MGFGRQAGPFWMKRGSELLNGTRRIVGTKDRRRFGLNANIKAD
jgi:hypothetical protein